jgi:hypothetical protein
MEFLRPLDHSQALSLGQRRSRIGPPDIQLKFAARAKSRIYHVPGGDRAVVITAGEAILALTTSLAFITAAVDITSAVG